MMNKTLAESYCESHRVPSALFEQTVLSRCLYPPARLLRTVLLLLNADYFEPDLELIRSAGRLTRVGGLATEVAEFNYHPANSGRLRREWKLRLSVTRLQRLVSATLQAESAGGGSMAPFAAATPSRSAAQPALTGSRK